MTLHSPLKNLGVIAPKIEKALELDAFMRKNYELFMTLTKVEKEILELITSGYTNKQISDMRFTALSTVQTHHKRIKRKLNAKDLVDLIRFAQAFDLI